MANANEVKVILSANAERLKREMAQARGSVESGARAMQSALGALGVGFGAVQTVRFFKGIIDDADAMSKLAQKTNMAVEQVAGWTHALDLASVSQEALQKTAKALGTQMLDASMGLVEAKRNFAALDIDIKNNDGSLKSVNEVLLEVADRYANATDKTAAAALLNKVLGKSALDLIPAFKDSRAALEAMIAEGQALNPVTAESARQAEQFNDNLKRLSGTIKKEFIVAMNAGLPALAQMSENIVRASKEGNTFLGILRELAKVDLALIGKAFPALEGITQKGFNALSAQDGTIARPGEVRGKIGGLPQVQPFTPKLIDEAAVAKALAAAKAAAAEMKKLRDLDVKGQIAYAQVMVDASDDEAKAIADIQIETAADWQEREDRLQKESIAGWVSYAQKRVDADFEEARALADIQIDAAKGNDIASDLGLTFSSAFEDAIVNAKNLRGEVKGLGQDIARIIARKTMTEPLGNYFSSVIKGIDFSKIFSFGGGKAGGGPLDPGKWYIAGERGPEPIWGGGPGAFATGYGAGGGSSNSSTPSQPMVVNFNVTANDARSFVQMLAQPESRRMIRGVIEQSFAGNGRVSGMAGG